MTRTRPFAELAAKRAADPARQGRIEEYTRAMDGATALARLLDREPSPPNGQEDLTLSDAKPAPADPGADIYLSTLGQYVADIGGRLVFEVVFPGLR